MKAVCLICLIGLIAGCKSSPVVEEEAVLGVGVAACDAYIAKYSACLEEKVPASDRSRLAARLNHQTQTWKRLAADPATRPGLSETCQFALDKSKPALKKFGCDS
ncbi:MAG: hypothetical protein QNJ97_13025 [Myxococcota bacterium]|nr:hypothetical protein [Myxococcota bacterium]